MANDRLILYCDVPGCSHRITVLKWWGDHYAGYKDLNMQTMTDHLNQHLDRDELPWGDGLHIPTPLPLRLGTEVAEQNRWRRPTSYPAAKPPKPREAGDFGPQSD